MEENKFFIDLKNNIVPTDREFVPVTGLKPLKIEDLIFSNDIEDDRVNTSLHLNDYDWGSYSLSTRVCTKDNGLLRIQWNYFLMTTSCMMVTQILNNTTYYYYIEYDSDIFIKYLKSYMEKHLKQWDSNYAFNDDEIVLEFFNEVINKGNLCGKALDTKNVPSNLRWDVIEDEDSFIRKKIMDLNKELKKEGF